MSEWLDEFAANPFWSVPSDVTIPVAIDKESGRITLNEKGWKVLFLKVKMPTESINEWSETEIPFWARSALVKLLKQTDTKQRYVDTRFTRILEGEKSKGVWNLDPKKTP